MSLRKTVATAVWPAFPSPNRVTDLGERQLQAGRRHSAMSRLRQNPHRGGTPTGKPFVDYWQQRCGVQYTIDDSAPTVQLLDSSHRWDAYR
jgi:hypothetical protein